VYILELIANEPVATFFLAILLIPIIALLVVTVVEELL
jgi:hypothetical protein